MSVKRRAKIQCPNCEYEGEGVCTYHYPRKRNASRGRRVAIRPDDAAWAVAVKSRDGYTCRRCGGKPDSPQGLHAAHIFGRGRKSTRHDLDNGVTLCMGCHSWGHANPREFDEWVISWMGEEKYEALRVKSQTLAKRPRKRKDTE